MILAPFKAIRPRPQQLKSWVNRQIGEAVSQNEDLLDFLSLIQPCLLYTSPSPRDGLLSRMPSSA